MNSISATDLVRRFLHSFPILTDRSNLFLFMKTVRMYNYFQQVTFVSQHCFHDNLGKHVCMEWYTRVGVILHRTLYKPHTHNSVAVRHFRAGAGVTCDGFNETY